MFTLWKGHCPAVSINQTIIPQTEVVKIPRPTVRFQVKLERTHRQKKKTNRLKTEDINRLMGKNPIYL